MLLYREGKKEMADRIQLCIFDMRRGQVEGQELDKILFFSPSNCPLPSQLSIIGLSEGLITFTRRSAHLRREIGSSRGEGRVPRKIFSPHSPCELMEAERHTHLFYQCEPDLWMVMVVEKSKDSEEATRAGALRAMLKEAHDLFTLFYGSIRALLHAHPGGDVARSCLHAFFPDYLSDFVVGKKFRLPTIGDSLMEKGFVQLLQPQPQTLLAALSLKEMLRSWFGGRTVRHVLILFHNIMLTSTLSPADTATLFNYATVRMLPSQLSVSSTRHSSSLRDRLEVADSNLFSTGVSNSLHGHSRLRHFISNLSISYPAGDTVDPPSFAPDVASAGEQRLKSSVPRPLSCDAWWRVGDGFLDTDAWGTGGERNSGLPAVWLQASEEHMHLCVYQYKSLTIVMLIPTHAGAEAITNLKSHLLEKALERIQGLEEKLVKEWPGINAWHVAGYRYLYCDRDHKVSRFSPASKVATLSKDSLVALNRIRADIDLETGRIERNATLRDRVFELCVRTKQNAWIIVRGRAGQELYTVLERTSNTLLLACEAVEKLSKRYFNGFFSSD